MPAPRPRKSRIGHRHRLRARRHAHSRGRPRQTRTGHRAPPFARAPSRPEPGQAAEDRQSAAAIANPPASRNWRSPPLGRTGPSDRACLATGLHGVTWVITIHYIQYYMQHALALAVREGGLLCELLWGVEPHAIPKRRAAEVAGLSPSRLAPVFGVADGRRAAGACGRYISGHVSWHSGVKES